MAWAHFSEGKLRESQRCLGVLSGSLPGCSQVPFLVCKLPRGPAVAKCQPLEAI